jgi:sugar lactone lactonase YvrE
VADDTLAGFEPVASGLYLEGLGVDLERGVVWYSDVIAGGVHGLWSDGRTKSFNLDRMWTGGVLINDDGCVLSSGPGGIMWNNPQNDDSGWLLNELDGKPINGVNEMVPDGTGGIYFGTNDIDSIVKGEPTKPPTAIYRLTRDLQVIKVADGLNFTNGLILSPDRRRLYISDTFSTTYAFDVQPDLSLTNRRILIAKDDADGMAMDVEGNLWITGFKTPEITRIRPNGERLAPVATPGRVVTQLRFFGPDMRDYYINTVRLGAGEELAVGELPKVKTSILYRGRSDVPGEPVGPASFRLAR